MPVSRKTKALPRRAGRASHRNKKRGSSFWMRLYENRGFKPGGQEWLLTENGYVGKVPPNDEIAAFTITGDPGVIVELFDDKVPNRRKTWGIVTLTASVRSVSVPNLKFSTSTYVHHQMPGEPTLDGRVSLIQTYTD